MGRKFKKMKHPQRNTKDLSGKKEGDEHRTWRSSNYKEWPWEVHSRFLMRIAIHFIDIFFAGRRFAA
jgi:hypothetical protein